jgi:hypothetical protein
LKKVKLVAITAYLCIILKGQMIAVPLIAWLLFTLFNFGSLDQLFAMLAIVGLGMLVVNWRKTTKYRIFLLELLSFVLMSTPLLSRLWLGPIAMFDYVAFIVPASLYVLLSFVSLLGSYIYSKNI